MASDPIVNEFAKFLAGIADEDERKRMMRQATALAMNMATDEVLAPEPPIRTLEQYLNDPIEIPPILVGSERCPIVVRGGVNGTIGRAGKGKTVMALNRMLRWCAGLPMFDTWTDPETNEPYLAPLMPLKILVVENEGAGGLFHKQIGIMSSAAAYLNDEQRKLARQNMLIWGDGGYSGLKLDDDEKLNWLRSGIEKWEPDIVFIEPFRGLWNGEENSATDMAVVVDAMVAIAADYQCGVLVSHHERKSGVGDDGEKMSAGRGSTVLEGVVTVMENFEGVKNNEFRELSWSKSRHGRAPAPVRMEWDSDAWWYKHVEESDLELQIVNALRENDEEPMTVSELREITDEKEKKLRDTLNALKDKGTVKAMGSVSNGRGSTGIRWRLATGGPSGGGLPV